MSIITASNTTTVTTFSVNKLKRRIKLKILAREDLWHLATLSNKKAAELRSATRCIDHHWFNTTGAAFYCLCKTGDSNTDWHSLLLENRRCQYDKADMTFFGRKPRGNVERLSQIVTFTVRRKVYYTSLNLEIWLAEYLSRKVH